MKRLVSVILVLFGLSILVAGGVEIYAGEDSEDLPVRVSHVAAAVMGAGLLISGPGLARNLPWAAPLALFNLAGMAALSLLHAFYQRGDIHATHHATRALLSLFLALTIVRMKRSG